jgi:hypothetical protein
MVKEIGRAEFFHCAEYRIKALAFALPELRGLVEQCLMFNPTARPLFHEIMNDLISIQQIAKVEITRAWPYGTCSLRDFFCRQIFFLSGGIDYCGCLASVELFFLQ